uniref:Divergent CRAL/TRIO domain containing protein, putative n=1 Tax=Theileria annulata TaxID=5874 RepID=A0A3B0MMR7_THEAN
MDSDIVEAVTWLASEFAELADFIEDPFPEEHNDYKVVPINKISTETVPSWNSVKLPSDEIALSTNVPKFLVNEAINNKIHVGSSDLLGLEVEAFTIFLEESNKYKSKMVKRLVARGKIQSNGQLELEHVHRMRSGESHLTRVYNVGSTNAIFAMICRYSKKYHDASTNILNMAVRESLKEAIEKGIDILAYPTSIEEDVVYPDFQYLDTLLRTLRRWLELPEVSSKISKIYLISHTPAESYYSDDSTASSIGAYNCMEVIGNKNDSSKDLLNLLRRYFPRTNYEELLSADLATTGNVNGEIVSEERNIRISEGFSTNSSKPVSSKPVINLAESLRVSNDSDSTQKESEYSYYLKLYYSISKLPVYTKLRDSRFVEWQRTDPQKRPVLIINTKNYEISNPEYSLCYILGCVKAFIHHKFVIVVLHLDHSIINSTSLLNLLSNLCRIFGKERTKNIAAIYFHKCSWALRSYLFFTSALLPTEVWDATVFVDSYREVSHLGLDPSLF